LKRESKVLEIVRREAIGAGGSCILKLFSVGCARRYEALFRVVVSAIA
jgi:hypothetical protein